MEVPYVSAFLLFRSWQPCGITMPQEEAQTLGYCGLGQPSTSRQLKYQKRKTASSQWLCTTWSATKLGPGCFSMMKWSGPTLGGCENPHRCCTDYSLPMLCYCSQGAENVVNDCKSFQALLQAGYAMIDKLIKSVNEDTWHEERGPVASEKNNSDL